MCESLLSGAKPGGPRTALFGRGVNLDKLAYVLAHGIDVPSGYPLWVDVALEKAWEYGGPRKLLMIFSNDYLQTAHCVLPLDTPYDKLEAYKAEYRTILRLENRGQIYLSRLDQSDPRVGSDSEVAYCRFPVGDPFAGLVALIVVLPPEADAEPIKALLAAQ
jgi:hypothetical protein